MNSFFQSKTYIRYIRKMLLILAPRLFDSDGLFFRVYVCSDIKLALERMYKLALEQTFGREKFELSRLELSFNISANSFALSDWKSSIWRQLDRGETANLPLLRLLLAIRQNLWEPNFCVVIDSLVLLASVSSVDPRTSKTSSYQKISLGKDF